MVFKTQKIRPREIREKAGKRPGSQHGKKQKKKKQLQNASSIVPDQPRPTTIIGVGIELFRGVISSLIGRWREASKCSGIIRRVLYMSSRLSITSRRVASHSRVKHPLFVSPIADLGVVGFDMDAYKLIVSHSHSCGPVIMLGGTPGGPCCPELALPTPPPWGTIEACIDKLFCCDPNRFCMGCGLGCPSLLLRLKPLLPILMSSASSMFVS